MRFPCSSRLWPTSFGLPVSVRFRSVRWPGIWVLCLAHFALLKGYAQQFAGDNQWVAPYGVATLVGTAGQNYSQLYFTIAAFPEWELNLQLVHYYDDPSERSESYTQPSFYAKRRFWQNEDETAGYAIEGGLGIFPQHLDRGEVTSNFRSWWVMGVATYAFANNNILLDFLPGATVNLDHKQSNSTAWGFTYSSRLAVYKVIPHTALVGEVFGTAGEANSPFSYRAGFRYEQPRWILAATYSSSFDGVSGAGFEIGLMIFTNPLFGPNHKRK